MTWSANAIFSTTHWISRLLVDALLKSVLIFVIAGIAAAAARRRPARLRHGIWAAALGLCAIAPIASALVGSHTIDVARHLVRVERVTTSHLADGGVLVTMHGHAAGVPFAVTPLEDNAPGITPPPNDPAPPALKSGPEPGVSSVDTMVATVPATSLETNDNLVGMTEIAGDIVIGAIWGVGVVISLCGMAWTAACLFRLQRRLAPVDDKRIIGIVSNCAERLGITRQVRVLIAKAPATLGSPATWGGRSPVVALPFEAPEWTDDRLSTVMLHEMAHIRRHDWYWQCLTRMICAFQWHNPLVWQMARHLRAECERACDEAVVNAGVPTATYADHLLAIAVEAKRRRAVPALAATMVRRKAFERRLRDILAVDRKLVPIGRHARIVAVIAAIATLTAGIGLRFATGKVDTLRTASAVISPASWGSEPATIILSNGSTVVFSHDSVKMQMQSLITTMISAPRASRKMVITRLTAHDRTAAPWSTSIQAKSVIQQSRGDVWTNHATEGSLTMAGKPGSLLITVLSPLEDQPPLPPGDRNPRDGIVDPEHPDTMRMPVEIRYLGGWADPSHDEVLRDKNMLANGVTISGSDGRRYTNVIVDHEAVRHTFQSGDSASLTAMVAAGPWTTVIPCNKTPGRVTVSTPQGNVLFTLGDTPSNSAGSALPSPKQVAFSVSDHIGGTNCTGFQRTLMALDRDGKLVALVDGNRFQDGPAKEYMEATIPAATLQRISRFLLCVRPYQTVTFANVTARTHS